MSTLTIVIIIIVALLLFVAGGYFLWQYADDNYGFNIFGLWILIRGLFSFISIYIAMIVLNSEESEIDQGVFLLLGISGLLLIWNFIVTWKNTNLVIGFLSFIYQLIAIWIFIKLINKAIAALD